ncbi:MAG: hypothetical protein ACLR23_29000 [Clostridia bacterium]
MDRQGLCPQDGYLLACAAEANEPGWVELDIAHLDSAVQYPLERPEEETPCQIQQKKSTCTVENLQSPLTIIKIKGLGESHHGLRQVGH